MALTVEALVIDEPALREFAAERYRASWERPLPAGDLGSIVREALVVSNANPMPADYGLELVDCGSAELSSDDGGGPNGVPRVIFTLELAVLDELAVRAFAAQHPESRVTADTPIETVILEALVLISDNPRPVDYGIEILRAEVGDLAGR
ncbi:MAG: hypothetical protein JST59_29415 [Actinobacteria bacterium]|nr:hypothetical protein [Actinomycetota bacterium]